jgi:hypothetical protein
VVEHPVIVKRSHSVQWKREVFHLDQKKLATLKATQGGQSQSCLVISASVLARLRFTYTTMIGLVARREFTMSKLISIAAALAFLALGAGKRLWILFQVRKAQVQILLASHTSKWRKGMTLPSR